MGRHIAGPVGLFLYLLIGADVPALAEGEVDCSSTELDMAAPGYTKRCFSHDKDVAFAGEGSAGPGNAEVEAMEAIDKTNDVLLVVVSMRLTANRFGWTHDDLRKVLGSLFSELVLTDWSGKANRSGFEIAEFSARGVQCVGFQRYFNMSFGVYKRRVVGYGCAGAGSGMVYGALENLNAPGG